MLVHTYTGTYGLVCELSASFKFPTFDLKSEDPALAGLHLCATLPPGFKLQALLCAVPPVQQSTTASNSIPAARFETTMRGDPSAQRKTIELESRIHTNCDSPLNEDCNAPLSGQQSRNLKLSRSASTQQTLVDGYPGQVEE